MTAFLMVGFQLGLELESSGNCLGIPVYVIKFDLSFDRFV